MGIDMLVTRDSGLDIQDPRSGSLSRYTHPLHSTMRHENYSTPSNSFARTCILWSKCFALLYTSSTLILNLAQATKGFVTVNPKANRAPLMTMMNSQSQNQTPSSVDDDVRALNEYFSAAVELSNGHVSDQGLLTVTRSVRDIDCNARRRYLYSIPCLGDGPDVSSKGDGTIAIPPVELNENVKMRLPSPSGKKVALLRQEDKDQILEIWTHGGQALERRINLSKASLHGKLIADEAGTFGGPSWNNAESAIVYVAERKALATSSFFEPTTTTTTKKSFNEPTTNRGAEHTLGFGKTESWGEKYSGMSPLLDLFVLDITTGNVGKVENVPGSDNQEAGYTLGQPIFTPDDEMVVYVGWDAGGGDDMPRRLGMIYCIQRPSKLYVSPVAKLLKKLLSEGECTEEADQDVDSAYTTLTPQNRVARSPRFSPLDKAGGCSLIYLATDNVGFDTHSGCFTLYSMQWGAKGIDVDSSRVLVKQVHDPRESPTTSGTVDGLSFPGLFLQHLPKECFISTNYLLTTVQWGSSTKVVRISVLNGDVSLLQLSECNGSEKLVAVTPSGGAIISMEAPNAPPTLHQVPSSYLLSEDLQKVIDTCILARFPSVAASNFCPVSSFSVVDFTFQIKKTTVPSVEDVSFDLDLQSILLLPSKDKHSNPPLIVVPHGGPHGASLTTYLPSYAYLCGHGGYAILLVNYRGSTGFGQGSIESLKTRIGHLDVKDVIEATREVTRSGLVDSDMVAICGGSHGGFLTGHCTSQFPDLFKAAAMRNPVVNLVSMVTTTDIPDWCYVEALGQYHWRDYRPPTKNEIKVMYEKSPIAKIEDVKTPTLVALGLQDLRVPPSQGLEWYHTLRSKQVPCKLLQYEDSDHAIAGVASEADHWINIKQWFDRFLLRKQKDAQ